MINEIPQQFSKRFKLCTYTYFKVCRSQWTCGLRPHAFWDCEFESRLKHGLLSLVSIVCFHVQVCA
jgi:hypothetical protein